MGMCALVQARTGLHTHKLNQTYRFSVMLTDPSPIGARMMHRCAGRTRVPHTLYYKTTEEYTNIHSCLLELRTEVSVSQQFRSCMLPCADQIACGQNVTFLMMRVTRENLHTVLRQKHLTYISVQDFFGPDQLAIWVSDQGYTDEWYNIRRAFQVLASQEAMRSPVLTSGV